MTTPTFFVVGAAKSGTTTVYHALRAHQDVYLPAVKEPHVYAALADPPAFAHLFADEAAARRRQAELYAGVDGEREVGDSSTTSLSVPGTAEVIAREAPGARIIAILRQPVDRAFSHYGHFRAAGAEELDFLSAVRGEDARQADDWPLTYRYMGWGRYAQQLRPFIELLGHQRVLAVLYDDLRADTAAAIRRILSFLELDPHGARVSRRRYNDVRLMTRGGGSAAGLRRIGRIVRRRPRLDGAVRAQLTREIAGEIDELEALLGLDLSAWRA